MGSPLYPSSSSRRAAVSPDLAVRASVARKGDLCEVDAWRLAKDGRVEVRVTVAVSTKDEDILAYLSKDPSELVRSEVAMRANSLSVLEDLSFDSSDLVRLIVASRADIQLSLRTVARLFDDPDEQVREVARAHLSDAAFQIRTATF